MNSAFRYRSEQILDIVRAEKRLRNSQPIAPEDHLPFKSYGQAGPRLDLDIDLADGPLLNLVFHVRASVVSEPATYEAALIPDGTRIRGVGYAAIEQTRWFRSRIPKGWHHNILDPNLDGDDGNRHEALPGFEPTDLDGFFSLTARLWYILIPRGGQLL